MVLVSSFNAQTVDGTLNLGTVRLQPVEAGHRVQFLGTVPGTGSDQTVTATVNTGSDLLIQAVVLREGATGPVPGVVRNYRTNILQMP